MGSTPPIRSVDPDGLTIYNKTKKTTIVVKIGGITLQLKPGENTDQLAKKIEKGGAKFLAERKAKGTLKKGKIVLGDLKDADGFYVGSTRIDDKSEGAIFKAPLQADVSIVEGKKGLTTTRSAGGVLKSLLGDIKAFLGKGEKSGYHTGKKAESFLKRNPGWQPQDKS